ncbi:MAG: DegT/DnrJ/EryC1/StrS family aminotransferase [Bacteroidia bacterium]
MIKLHYTYIHPDSINFIADVLSSTLLSEGSVVAQFERMLEEKLAIKNVVTVNSGTSALHLSLVLAGIKESDEVILPAQTFIATGLSVLYQKAKVVFADINYNTGNIDPNGIRKKITKKTKAIICVHWAGYPCDMDEIKELAKEFNLAVIEDAAHAIGATYKNIPIGNLSDYTCFSFQAIKHLTTGDGGAISMIDKEKYELAKELRWFGINRSKHLPNLLGERQYNLTKIGYKYHLNNYAAALGIANLSTLQERIARRNHIASKYRKELSKIDGIKLFDYSDQNYCAYWLFGFHVEHREEFIRMMRENNIEAGVVHQRIDRNDIFRGIDKTLEQQALFDKTQVHIPVHEKLTDEEVDYIIQTIKKGWV